MSDNIPFEIQMEIIKWLPVKPLIQFRSVSKPWKSFIDSSEFVKGYGARHTQPHSHILRYKSDRFQDEANYICLIDDDENETFKVRQQEFAPFVMSPLLKQYLFTSVVGACHGLLCFDGLHNGSKQWRVVIWNPSIGKSFGIAVPFFYSYRTVIGFGVCPVTRDPTIVKILCEDNKPWHVEVFTLSSGVWNVIPTGNLPRQSIRLNPTSTQVVIDRFIYWAASEEPLTDDGVPHYKYVIVSFDLIAKEFKVVDLPDTFTNELLFRVSVSKQRESLVVYGYVEHEPEDEDPSSVSVWVMEHDSSFRKLFTIGTPVYNILGFKKNGETIFPTGIVGEDTCFTTLDVYDPSSQQIKNLGIFGIRDSFIMGSCMESLLLLDHLDSLIY